jgi:membrane protease YdiL (CAAX protease family)
VRSFITCDTTRPSSLASLDRMIGYLGAGIYEELLFRLMLLPATIAAFRYMQMTPKASMIAGVIVSSILFSLAHYRMEFRFLLWHVSMTHGYSFEWFSFVFRFSAGVFFSLLFLFRGFGIAAGSHAIYDILAVLL